MGEFGDDPVGDRGPAPAAVRPRTRFPEVPGYQILCELGRGGMGVVYKARQLGLNRLVALKMILAGEHAGPDALRRLLAEAETIAQLQHPNVVQIHAVGDCNGRPYIELELVEGGNLAERLEGTPWPPAAAARLVQDLARAVAQAHRLGIVHRDLKPSNILLTDDGSPKVSDFGLAKSLERDMGLTQTESILGSPSYMAPEQANGHAKEVGPAADIYALGAILYELLTGRPPFVAPSILATLDLVKNAEPVSPGHLQPGVPRDLETICLKCLQKRPQGRYESAEALTADLASFLEGKPIRARRTPPWERALKWTRRHPSAAGLIVVTLLALVSSVGGGAWYRAEKTRQVEAAYRRVATLQSRADHFVVLGEEALRREDWAGARTQLSSALALISAEPRLAETRTAVEGMLAQSEQRIAEQQAREAARSRFARFQRLYDEAVFYESGYTGLDPDANLRASRHAARRALALFGLSDQAATGLVLTASHFDAPEVQAITSGCYELTLILAETTAQPLKNEDPADQARAGLRILEGTRRIQNPTPAYHLRRAALLAKIGDKAEAKAEQERSENASVTDRSAVDHFLVGEQAYRRHDLSRAVSAFRHALVLQPDHFWAQYLLAVCHLKAHRPAEAQASLIACQSRRPGFVWTYLLKGFAEGEMGEFDLAEADFRRASDLGLDEQGQYVMLVNRGVMRIRRGHNQAAIEDLEAAIRRKPDQFQAYVNLAQALQNLKRYDDAVRVLDGAIERVSDQAVLYRARSQVYRAWSKRDDALADLDRAIALSAADDPVLASDHLESGLIHQQAGRYGEALAACDRALALRPDWPNGHRLRGVVLVALKRYDEAIRAFDLCLGLGGPTPALYEARGLALASRGSYPRAISDYTLALTSGRDTPSLHANRGWAYLFSGAPELALGDFDATLRSEPANSHALSGRALAHVQLRKPEEAVADARASTRSGSHDARIAYNAARVLSQAAACHEADPARGKTAWEIAGRYRTEALQWLARAIELTPRQERTRFWVDVVRPDTALEQIRRSRHFAEMDDQVPHQPPRRLAQGGTKP
ncbi:MAG: protein kinase [Isosphaeraceae bacterium]|nr:protein kinase [Isosphaeraceae bacterium]